MNFRSRAGGAEHTREEKGEHTTAFKMLSRKDSGAGKPGNPGRRGGRLLPSRCWPAREYGMRFWEIRDRVKNGGMGQDLRNCHRATAKSTRCVKKPDKKGHDDWNETGQLQE